MVLPVVVGVGSAYFGRVFPGSPVSIIYETPAMRQSLFEAFANLTPRSLLAGCSSNVGPFLGVLWFSD